MAHHIEKPIDKKSFKCAVDRAISALAAQPVEYLICRTDRDTIEKVPLSSIIMAESCLKEQKLHLTDGRTLLLHAPLSLICEKLSANSAFMSPHRSFIIRHHTNILLSLLGGGQTKKAEAYINSILETIETGEVKTFCANYTVNAIDSMGIPISPREYGGVEPRSVRYAVEKHGGAWYFDVKDGIFITSVVMGI